MNRRGSALLALLGLWLALPVAAWAGLGVEYSGVKQIVIQQGLNGYNRVADTHIHSGAATTNYGAADTLKISSSSWTGYQSGQHKILIKFDVPAALHDSAVVVQAYLGLYQCAGYAVGTALDTVRVLRVGEPWNEGTGGNAGAVQSGNACWNNRYTGPTAWLTAGASNTSTNNPTNGATTYFTHFYMNQWMSSTQGAGGDSLAVGYTATGTDTMWNGIGSFIQFDVARDPIAQSTLKVGTPAGNNRQGWVFWNVGDQVRRWQIGANEDDGFLLQFHNQTANRLFAFYSSNYGTTSWQVAHRPMLIIRYILVSGTGSESGTSVSNRRGVAILGPGAR